MVGREEGGQKEMRTNGRKGEGKEGLRTGREKGRGKLLQNV